jgi:hypothetical protein
MSDKSHPTTDNEEEMNLEDEARLARRYHLGAVAEASAIMESVLRAIFSSLLGSPPRQRCGCWSTSVMVNRQRARGN